MNQAEFNALCVAPSCTLRDALLRLDTTARGLLMVLSEAGQLVRTLTDGDLRRARLSGLDDATLVRELPAQPPQVVHEDAAASAVLELMDRHQIDHIPVLDAQDRPVDVVFRRELSRRVWLSFCAPMSPDP